MISVSSVFDGGNIDLVRQHAECEFDLAIRQDQNAEFLQWFYFRLTGAAGKPVKLNVVNAGAASYTEGFKNYRAVASEDRDNWRRIDTQFDGHVLTLNLTPESNSVYIAYFAPYDMMRHADLVTCASGHPFVTYECLGSSLDGRDMDMLKISRNAFKKPSFWIVARQHPGETMAEWWMEGFIARILDESDPISKALLEAVDLYLVPNMNPDGSFRGHLRTNAAGANLNREWQGPSLENSPEVFHVLTKMHDVGVDFCLDVHGDEALPYNFLVGPEGIPDWNDDRQKGFDYFKETLAYLNLDFQTEKGYPKPAKGKANLSVCTNFIAQTFGCLAMTLEMPFKDSEISPDPIYGWSPERCQRLAEATLHAIYHFQRNQYEDL